MATLRKDSFAQQFPARYRGISDTRLKHRLSGISYPHITMDPPKTPFTAALDDVYGTHVVFGDEAEARIAEIKAEEERQAKIEAIHAKIEKGEYHGFFI